jgi:hypothetical protein
VSAIILAGNKCPLAGASPLLISPMLLRGNPGPYISIIRNL